jgi:hypothetical protein
MKMPSQKLLDSCSLTLPSFTQYFREKKRSLQEKIIQNGQLNFLSIQSTLSCKEQQPALIILLYEIVRHIINRYPREMNFNPLDQQAILVLLYLCPEVTKVHDEDHLFLIHHLCLMERPDQLILCMLIEANPSSLFSYGSFGYFEATPLHLKLMKSETNFEMALYMLMSCPRSAR